MGEKGSSCPNRCTTIQLRCATMPNRSNRSSEKCLGLIEKGHQNTPFEGAVVRDQPVTVTERSCGR
jgi:hypothetical protein